MSDRNLEDLHPDLKPLCEQWLAKCQQQSIGAFVTQTYRSVAEQDAMYAQGRTAPGKIVTNARGGHSAHNFAMPDGTPAAKAFDFAIKSTGNELNWNVNSPEWKAAIAIGQDLNMVWGGSWKSIKDYDHFQLAE